MAEMAIGLDDTDQIENSAGFNGNTFLFTNAANGADAAVLVKQGSGGSGSGPGTVELWAGGSAAAQTFVDAYSNNEGLHSILVTVNAPSGYGAGASGSIDVSIDGGFIGSQAITFDGVSSGYLSFYSNLNGSASVPEYGAIDNLVVTAIPEPGSLALLGLGGLVMLRRRWH